MLRINSSEFTTYHDWKLDRNVATTGGQAKSRAWTSDGALCWLATCRLIHARSVKISYLFYHAMSTRVWPIYLFCAWSTNLGQPGFVRITTAANSDRAKNMAARLQVFQATTARRAYINGTAALHHRNIRPRMRAPILSQVNKWRYINYSKWLIYQGKLNSPHDLLYTTLLGKIQDGGFIRAFLFSFTHRSHDRARILDLIFLCPASREWDFCSIIFSVILVHVQS